MKLKGPVVTLLGGLVVAAVLFALSVAAAEINEPNRTNAGNATAVLPSATPSASESPAAAAATAGAGQADPTATPVTFAGKVNGGAATLAIAVKEGKAIAYLCNGRTLESWMQGEAAGGQMNLAGTQEGTLTATFDTNGATGSVSAAGRSFTFQIKPVEAPSGLYRLSTQV